MPSLLSSNFDSAKKSLLRQSLVWLFRELTGLLFVYSGFVKSIDPWGTIFKFNEYFAAMGLDIWPNLTVVGVFALCAVEFTIGVFLMAGCFRVSTPRIGLLFMCVMLPLTLWVAVKDPVADCGCFGDALKISNWATFWKNVVLTAMFIYLIPRNKYCRCLISPPLQWIACVATGAYIVCIGLYGYLIQPMIDFRAYPEGSALFHPNEDEETEDGYVFVYSKDGVEKEFDDINELPSEEDGWTFVERREPPHVELRGSVPKPGEEKNFRIWSEDGEEDVTEDALDPEARYFILLLPDLKELSPASSWRINSLYDWCEDHDIEMIGVTGGSREEIEDWKDLSMPQYPIYIADDTLIEEVARGNPAVVYYAYNEIKWKSSLWGFKEEDFLGDNVAADPMAFRQDSATMLRNLTGIFIGVIGVLIALSFMPRLYRLVTRRPKAFRLRRKEKEERDGDNIADDRHDND